MSETRILQRRRVVFERAEPFEHLRFALHVFDERDKLVELLARLTDLAPAQAPFAAAVTNIPTSA